MLLGVDEAIIRQEGSVSLAFDIPSSFFLFPSVFLFLFPFLFSPSSSCHS